MKNGIKAEYLPFQFFPIQDLCDVMKEEIVGNETDDLKCMTTLDTMMFPNIIDLTKTLPEYDFLKSHKNYTVGKIMPFPKTHHSTSTTTENCTPY